MEATEMGDQIFSDGDQKFRMARTKDGVHISVTCIYCETDFTVKHSWQEVRAMLQGQRVPGVENTNAGWTMKTECPNAQCNQQFRYEIEQSELEHLADQQISAMQRMANMR